MTPHDTPFLDLVRQRVVTYDGAMGTSVQNYDLEAEGYGGIEGCNENLVFHNPGLIEEIHASFFEVGVDVVETDTFGGSLLKLEEYGLGERTFEQNRDAARLARRVADRYATAKQPRFVAGSIGPTGLLPASEDPMLGTARFQEVVDLFLDQVRGLVDGGVDVLLIETTQDLLELKAAVHAILRVRQETGQFVPIQAQVTLDTSGRMLLGTDIAAALTVLEVLPIDIIGLNCSTGPEHMREPARYLGEYSTKPVAIIPNAGLPLNVDGKALYPLEPEPMAKALRQMVEEFGVGLVGGCCGTTPEHLAAVVREIGRRPTSARPMTRLPLIASMVRAVDLHQDPAPLIVGERVNTLGSRKVKRLALADDDDGILEVARSQMEEGAHALDVCVAMTERTDEREMLRRLTKKLALQVEGPLVLDSTEADVLQDALEQYPGRAVVNSINMENGRGRIEAVMPHAVAHGAAVVAMTIDEEGMAKTAARKVAVAEKIHAIVTQEYGLAPDALIFDPLTFPLSTGEEEFVRSAVETIEGIRQIEAKLPGVLTILGISNVSFGLNPVARKIVNAVFLYHAVEAGLDLAIVHPSHVVPYAEIPAEERALAEDLVLAKRPDALARLIDFFEGREEEADAGGPDPMESMTAEERLHHRILFRKKEGIEADIDQAVAKRDPVEVLNSVLLPAMKEVGDKFGAGELILPFVLQSAEAMKRAVGRLETYLEKQEGVTKGTVVLATVFGDVHDIGKNLVNTILTNNGYTVHDLGKQVPVNRIIDKAREVNATAIGLSALLVSTSKQMPLCVKELHHADLQFPVIIGGAAINRAYAQRTLFVDEQTPYEPGVFYAKDAFEGLSLMDRIVDPKARKDLVRTTVETARSALARPSRAAFSVPSEAAKTDGSTVRQVDPPTPPFWGVREMDEIALADIWPHLDLKTLFRLHWGGKGLKDEVWEQLKEEEFLPRLRQMQAEAEREGWLQPRVRYGYFPANSDGNDLVIFRPDIRAEEEIGRFAFPRQPARDRLCLADYYLPLAAGRRDVAVFQIVTVGPEATARTERLQAAGEYAESFFSHGLSVQSAEGLAEYVHQRIRRALGMGEEQGKRYSWGYPSCPDLEQHALVDHLLDASAIGIKVTEGFQFDPEQTTAALVVTHPDARYFALTRTGGE